MAVICSAFSAQKPSPCGQAGGEEGTRRARWVAGGRQEGGGRRAAQGPLLAVAGVPAAPIIDLQPPCSPTPPAHDEELDARRNGQPPGAGLRVQRRHLRHAPVAVAGLGRGRGGGQRRARSGHRHAPAAGQREVGDAGGTGARAGRAHAARRVRALPAHAADNIVAAACQWLPACIALLGKVALGALAGLLAHHALRGCLRSWVSGSGRRLGGGGLGGRLSGRARLHQIPLPAFDPPRRAGRAEPGIRISPTDAPGASRRLVPHLARHGSQQQRC